MSNASPASITEEHKVFTDRYLLRDPLGRGSMAAVYRAMDQQTSREVALKMLWPHLRSDELVEQRFRREFAVLQRLQHPHIIDVFDLADDGETLALVMDFAPGGSLEDRLREDSSLDVDAVLRLAIQGLDALAEAHTLGIVHRDLKPSNLLFDARGDLLLSDFGIAHVADMVALTTQTMILGAPEYMAPEQARSSQVDARADLYAFAAILFRALSGQLPFRALSPLDVIRKHSEEEPPDIRQYAPGVPDEIADTLRAAMDTDPQRRFPTARAMRRALLGETTKLHWMPQTLASAVTCPHCDAPTIEASSICVECGKAPAVASGRPRRRWHHSISQGNEWVGHLLDVFTVLGFLFFCAVVLGLLITGLLELGVATGEGVLILFATVAAITGGVLWFFFRSGADSSPSQREETFYELGRQLKAIDDRPTRRLARSIVFETWELLKVHDEVGSSTVVEPDGVLELTRRALARSRARAESELESALTSAHLLAAQARLGELRDDLRARRGLPSPMEALRKAANDLENIEQAVLEVESDIARWEREFEERADGSVGSSKAALPERFDVIEELGHGATGRVFKCHDHQRDQTVALKVLHDHLRTDRATVMRFRREVELMQQLDDEYIIAVHELVESDAMVAIVMEFHPGRDLDQRIEDDGPLHPDAVERLAHQVLQGLQSAHAQGIVHGDIKPHNLLLNDEGHVKIIDFGIARQDFADMTESMHLGTPEYMAPELLSSPLCDGRADLYGLGISLYEATTGELPFQASTLARLVDIHRQGLQLNKRPLRHLSAPLRQAIQKAVASDPVDRFETAEAMLAALDDPDATEREGSTPEEPCLVCGKERISELITCLACGSHRTLQLGGSGTAAIVLWPPPNREHYTEDERRRLSEFFVEIEGAEAVDNLDDKLSTLPAVIAQDLSDDDGKALAAYLKTMAINVEVVPSLGKLPYGAFLKSQLTDLKRSGCAPIFALAFGSLFFFILAIPILYSQLDSRPVSDGLLLGTPIVVGLVLFFYVYLARIEHLMTVEPIDRKAQLGPPWEAEARELYQEVESHRLRQLMHRFVSLAANRWRVAQSNALVLDSLDKTVEQWFAAIRQTWQLETDLTGLSAGQLRRELDTVQDAIERSNSTSQTAELIDTRVELLQQIRSRDEKYHQLAELMRELLSTLADFSASEATHVDVEDDETENAPA